MPIVITTQKEMQRARSAISFCYLCGSKLPVPIERKKKGVRPEHVVPSSLLGPPGSSGTWPVTLLVHGKCDEKLKQKQDTLVTSFFRLSSTSPETWSMDDFDNFKRLVRGPVNIDLAGNPQPLLPAKEMLETVVDWVRGMHTVLYRTFLPRRHDLFEPNSPLLSAHLQIKNDQSSVVSRDDIERGSKMYRDLWSLTEDVHRLAENSGNIDMVSAWDNKLLYKCVWVKGSGSRRRLKTGEIMGGMCIWSLEHPGVYELSATVDQVPHPWYGVYKSRDLPPEASQVSKFLSAR